MTPNQARLVRVCALYLHTTRWARELGDPVPLSHRRDPINRRNVTEIRHTRRVCRDVIERAETLALVVWEDHT